MGIRSTNGVNDHLRALERKGYLTREDMKSRALRPTQIANSNGHGPNGVNGANGHASHDLVANDNLIEIPILGRVAAGALTDAIENREDTVHIDRMLVGGARDVFGLRVKGESIIKAGIHDGDYVFVKKQLEARRGEIIVALVGEEATCKYYYPESDRVRLVPANDRMTDIVIDKSDWRSTQILGVVVGIYRKLN